MGEVAYIELEGQDLQYQDTRRNLSHFIILNMQHECMYAYICFRVKFYFQDMHESSKLDSSCTISDSWAQDHVNRRLTLRRKAMQSSNCLSILSTSISHLALMAETAPPLLRVCCMEQKSRANPRIVLIRLAINAHCAKKT